MKLNRSKRPKTIPITTVAPGDCFSVDDKAVFMIMGSVDDDIEISWNADKVIAINLDNASLHLFDKTISVTPYPDANFQLEE